MVFSSFLFIYLFLPVFLLIYYLTPVKFRNLTALSASYIFYGWGAPGVILILAVSTGIDFYLSGKIASGGRKGKTLLAVAVSLNLSLLFYYKYANFFMGGINSILSSMSFPFIAWEKITLPIGISFFTFQKISYLVDIYRRKAVCPESVLDYALFVALFPQLIAGPIIRYHDVAEQIQGRTHSLDNFFYGFYRFCLGLGKKVLLADPMGAVADNVFSLSMDNLSTPFAWLGILAYSFQIYFDFAGYSDMAIGLGRMMGFKFLENFNCPYISENFTDFWRRWHISLSNWMREYLYIPLGGNRVSRPRMYLNLWIVFLLSGLWHGASWTFVAWGAYHGAFLAFDKFIWLNASKKLGRSLNTLLTFILVTIGWVFFRSETFSQAFSYLTTMFGGSSALAEATLVFRGDIINNRGIFVFALCVFFSFVPFFFKEKDLGFIRRQNSTGVGLAAAQSLTAFACLLLSTAALASAGFTPFLYFKF